MSNSKWLADKALAQLRNTPRIDLNNVYHVGTKPVSFFEDPLKYIEDRPTGRRAIEFFLFLINVPRILKNLLEKVVRGYYVQPKSYESSEGTPLEKGIGAALEKIYFFFRETEFYKN